MSRTGFFMILVTMAILTSACSKGEGMFIDEIPDSAEGMPEIELDPDLEFNLADGNAHLSVKFLYQRLKGISDRGIGFGHQDATAYGINWDHTGFPSDSDIRRVTGDYPAVMGFDVGNLESGGANNIDQVPFYIMKGLIKEAHDAGSIVTLSWHANNPITGNQPWDTTLAVPSILPGGENETAFKRYISRLADFLNTLIDDNGNPIPIIFRPWHEMNGNWFWWGNVGHTGEQYKTLFRETVTQLTAEGVHNLLYCYSPDTARTENSFLNYYPGDEWVDILGADVYDFLNEPYIPKVKEVLAVIRSQSEQRNKLFALTETGLENVTENDWWTSSLYPAIKDSGIAYMLVWRNDRNVHHFGPYENHGSADNFRELFNFDDILFQKDIDPALNE